MTAAFKAGAVRPAPFDPAACIYYNRYAGNKKEHALRVPAEVKSMKTVLKMLSLMLALSLALGALQIGAYAALNDGKKLTAVVKLEVGRMSGSTFTPLKDGENIAKDQVITVRIVPETDFLCGTVRFAVLFGKNAFTIIGSQKSAFTPNPSNTYYAKAVGDYSGATYVPLKVFQEVYGASAGQTMFNAYTAVCVTAQAQSNAANGGHPEYLPGTWLFRFNLKAVRNITADAGTKIVMDPRWVRTPEEGRTTLPAYFYKCESRDMLSSKGSSTTYNFILGFSGANIFLPKLAVPGNFKAASASYNSVKLSWNAVAGATGYVVYRSASASSGYARIKVTKELSLTDTGRTTGTKYYYKVRAYRTAGGTDYYGSPSAAVSAVPLPGVPGSFKAEAQAGLSVKLSWSAVPGATGYVLYRKSSLTNAYSRLKVLTGTSWTDKDGLVKGRTYSYKVRAYRTVSGKNYYGALSPAKSVTAR